MYVYLLVGTEDHPVYQTLATENLGRQYGFLRSITLASKGLSEPLLSIQVLKALNYHAITCLHASAGEFRPWGVTVGDYQPPPHYEIAARMEMFTNRVNRMWEETDPITLAAFVLWQLNWIHPFINGNGRAARAACHFVLCLKLGGWLSGEPILPELLRQNRSEYISQLKTADLAFQEGRIDLVGLHGLLARLVEQQIKGVVPPDAPPAEPANG